MTQTLRLSRSRRKRIAARRLMTPAQLWPITTIERRLGRPMTEQEERITVEYARWAATV